MLFRNESWHRYCGRLGTQRRFRRRRPSRKRTKRCLMNWICEYAYGMRWWRWIIWNLNSFSTWKKGNGSRQWKFQPGICLSNCGKPQSGWSIGGFEPRNPPNVSPCRTPEPIHSVYIQGFPVILLTQNIFFLMRQMKNNLRQKLFKYNVRLISLEFLSYNLVHRGNTNNDFIL